MSNDIFLYTVPAFSDPNDIELRILTSAQAVSAGWTTPEEFDDTGKDFEDRKRGRLPSREQFLALRRAEREAAAKADSLKNKSQKQALNKAADAVREVLEKIPDAPKPQIDHLAQLVEQATSAKRAKDAILQAHAAIAYAAHMAELADNDEEEQIIMMLLS